MSTDLSIRKISILLLLTPAILLSGGIWALLPQNTSFGDFTASSAAVYGNGGNGGKGEIPDISNRTPVPAQDNADNGSIVLTFWYTQDPASDEGLLLKTMVEEFEELHPNITVNMVPQNFFTAHDTYKNAYLSGTQPDIFRSAEGDVTEWMYLGAIREISDLIPDEDKKDFINISKYTAVYKTSSGEFWYGVPEVVDLLLLFYNKQIFQDAGIPLPPGPDDPQGWTWDEFRETAASLAEFMRDNGIGDYSFNIYKELQYSFNVFLWGFGGDYWDKDENGNYVLGPENVSIYSQESEDALNFLLDLKNNDTLRYRVMPEQNAGSETDFKEGKLAMILNGPWAVNNILKGSAFQNVYQRLGIAQIPGRWKNDTTPRTPVGGHTYVISKDCPHPEEAYELIDYLTDTAANVRRATELGLMPVRKSAYNDTSVMDDEKAEYFISQYNATLSIAHVGHPLLVNWKTFASDQLANSLNKIWTDSSYSADEILKEVQTQWEQNDYLVLGGGEEIRSVSYTGIILIFLAVIISTPPLYIAIKAVLHKRPIKGEFMKAWADVKRNKMAYIMISGTFIVLTAEVFIPLLITLDTSFRNYTPAAESSNPLTYRYPEYIGFSNYAEIFTDPLFFQVFFNTIFWTVTCVTLQVLFGLAISMMVHKDFRGKKFFLTLLILPWAVPSYVTVYIWRVFILQDSTLGEPGLFNMILTSLGYDEVRFLSADTAFYLPGISNDGITMFPVSYLMLSAIMVNVWLGIPFVVISFVAGLNNIPGDLYEAAKIEGAGRWYRFKKITLPMLKDTFMIVTLLGVIWTFNMFNVIFILATNTNIPQDSYSILAVWVYNLAFHNFTKGKAAAVSWIIFLVLMLFASVYKRKIDTEDK